WWILLLRLLIAGLVLLALAQPVMNLSNVLPGRGLVRIVMDNSWAAAETWDKQIAEAEEVIEQARREGREIVILTTALPGGQSTWNEPQILDAAKAKGILKSLLPLPWRARYEAAADFVRAQDQKNATSFWFSHGLYGKSIHALGEALLTDGEVFYYAPEVADIPIALQRAQNYSDGPSVGINAPDNLPAGTPVTV